MNKGIKIFKSDTNGLAYTVIATDKTDARFWVSTVAFVDIVSLDAGTVRIHHNPDEKISVLDVKRQYSPGYDLNIDTTVLSKLTFAAQAA
jgi:hypothetical protein